MFNLIQNENVKIYRRLRTWIFVGIVALAAIIVGVITKHVETPTPSNWKQSVVQQNEQLQGQINNGHMPASAKATLTSQMKINQYAIDHNIPPDKDTAWKFAADCAGIISLVTIFVTVVAGDSLASEFSAGTIKLLLIRPVNRTKIMIAKYLATLEFAFVMVVGLLVFSLILGGILFGFTGAGAPHFYTNSAGTVLQASMFNHVLIQYGFSCIELLMIVTISFMISAIFRSSSLAIALSILLMFLGNTAAQLLSRFDWDKYILFANTDLSAYFDGQPLVKGMTIGFSVAVLLVYFVIFHLASWLLFTRRDVGA